MERQGLLRDREPLVKNTTNQIKDLYLLRAESRFLPSGGRGQPGPPTQPSPPLPLQSSDNVLVSSRYRSNTQGQRACEYAKVRPVADTLHAPGQLTPLAPPGSIGYS